MSYILDALKKIEHEHNKKARSDGRVSISGDLFNEQKQPAARARIWKVLLLIVVASLMTFAGTWFLLKGNDQKVAAGVPAPQQQQPVPPVSQSVAIEQAAPLPAAPAVPEKNMVDEDDGPAPPRAIKPEKLLKTEAVASPPRQMSPTTTAPADIKLSGIAWQDDRRLRRAVINGFLLKEGAIVSGARITDIQADRVRFSSTSGLFEIKLDAVLPAEVQR